MPGNPACADVLPGQPAPYLFSFSVAGGLVPDAPETYTFPAPYADGSVTIDVDSSNLGPVFDFTINGPYAARGVIAKGGPNANFYNYAPPTYPNGIGADDNLHAPVNPANNTYYGLSRIDFCVVRDRYNYNNDNNNVNGAAVVTSNGAAIANGRNA
ncbi:hypothetical protein ACIHCQ_33410 [Streptomyces sp. NPDC052236]|uniref:hypothetical protein n=1 Tax=Streptomyces sp. NPDC052236 TaxID=3365686 RepID=UPI0037D8F00A